MQRLCMAVDLKDAPDLIDSYRRYHQHANFSPDVATGLQKVGVIDMEIFLVENRLTMIMEVEDHFNFESKFAYDNKNLDVREWELLMWSFQKALPNSKTAEKWRKMDKIFSLYDYMNKASSNACP